MTYTDSFFPSGVATTFGTIAWSTATAWNSTDGYKIRSLNFGI